MPHQLILSCNIHNLLMRNNQYSPQTLYKTFVYVNGLTHFMSPVLLYPPPPHPPPKTENHRWCFQEVWNTNIRQKGLLTKTLLQILFCIFTLTTQVIIFNQHLNFESTFESTCFWKENGVNIKAAPSYEINSFIYIYIQDIN